MRWHAKSPQDSKLHDDASRLAIERIAQLLTVREKIATRLRQVAKTGYGETAKRMTDLADWFQRDVTAEQVLRHPDAIIVCYALLTDLDTKTVSSDDQITDRHIDASVRETYTQLRHLLESRQSLLPRLAYPFTLLLFVFALFVFGSFYLATEFDQMFDEYGLILPVVTKFVLGLAESVRRWWMIGFASLVLLGILLIFIARSGRRRIPWPRWLRIQSLGLRTAWAKWAWHTGWLLKVGCGQSDAIAVAGSCSSEPWLRRNSLSWSDRLNQGTDPFANAPRGNWQPDGLLADAFGLESRHDQADLLHIYTLIHRDNAQLRRLWWLSWVTPAIMLLVGTMIGLFVIALYAPMIELISGLT